MAFNPWICWWISLLFNKEIVWISFSMVGKNLMKALSIIISMTSKFYWLIKLVKMPQNMESSGRIRTVFESAVLCILFPVLHRASASLLYPAILFCGLWWPFSAKIVSFSASFCSFQIWNIVCSYKGTCKSDHDFRILNWGFFTFQCSLGRYFIRYRCQVTPSGAQNHMHDYWVVCKEVSMYQFPKRMWLQPMNIGLFN